MRSVLNWKRFQRINLISSIIVLSLLGTSCTIRQFVPERKDYDAIYEGQNLVPNGDIEILDNGQPVRWIYQGKCAIGFPGFQSDHALIMEVPGQDNLPKWEAQINSIKPHTKYVISFWYRLPEKGRMELLIFGKSLPITQMFRYNPMHWCRYSAIVDSGEFNGKRMISFLAKQGVGRFKFWAVRGRISDWAKLCPVGIPVLQYGLCFPGYNFPHSLCF